MNNKHILQQRLFRLLSEYSQRKVSASELEEAIEELHYEVNEVARGLKTNATKTIGVVIPELNNVFCAEIISGMEDILRSHGYAAIVCDCRTDKKLEKEAVDFLTRKRVDGIINMPVDMTGAHLKKYKKIRKCRITFSYPFYFSFFVLFVLLTFLTTRPSGFLSIRNTICINLATSSQASRLSGIRSMLIWNTWNIPS